MAVYDLEEQEQIDSLKAWWKQYGNLVTTLVIILSAAALAYQAWNYYQRSQSAKAAGVYGTLQKSYLGKEAQGIKSAAGDLMENFGGTSYASLGALTAAKAAAEAGDLKTARLQLQWVLDKGEDSLRDLARLRLATIALDEKAYDEALKLVAAKPENAFAARYAELRGDALLVQGKLAEAKAAYKEAQELARTYQNAKLDGSSGKVDDAGQPKTPYQQLLQYKLDSVGDA